MFTNHKNHDKNLHFRTCFEFMANKQFRMEKNWEHQCALISHTMLSKTNMLKFYRKKSLKKKFWMKIWVFCRFLDQIWLQKTVFGLTSIQYLNVLQFIKNCC